MKKLQIVISGFVQGVSFRYYAQKKANELGLVGWVKNRVDGSVEVESLGEEKKLAEFLEWCRSGPDFARVKDIRVKWLEVHSGERLGEFEIRY